MREARGTGLLSAAGAAAVLVATLSFLPIVQGVDWWWAALVFVTAATAVSAWARSLGAPVAAGALLGLATLPLLATALDGAARGLLLVLPTTASSKAVLQVLSDAGAQIYADSVPAGSSPGITLLIASLAAVAALLVDAVAVGLKAPLPAMLVVLALAIVPGKALRTGTNGWLLVAVAVAVLLVVGADRYSRGSAPRLGGLAGGGVLALVLVLVAQTVLPAPALSAAADDSPLQPLFGQGADPLIRLGDDLRRGPDQAVLSYTTTTTDDVYLRLAVLEDFTGSTWTPDPADGSSVNDPPPVPGLEQQDTSTVTTRITPATNGAIGQRLPLPYPALRVSGAAGFQWDTRGLTLVRSDSSGGIGQYTVTSAAVDTSPAILRSAGTSLPLNDQGALDVPGSIPSIIRTTAASWTKGATSPYQQAVDIQNHLRDGAFLYDEQTPVQQGYDGDGLGVIAKFLQVKAGYCVHFASTMAVMARLEGIPARVVVGYQPGERQVVGGRNVYAVSSDDLHAWPELYFDGVGWVRFEPTPGRGAVPTYAPPPSTGASSASVNPKSLRSASASAAPSVAASASTRTTRADRARSSALGVLRGVGVAAVVALVLLAPAGLRRTRRRRRLGRLARGGPASIGWQEIVDTGWDLGVPPPRDVSLRTAETALRHDLRGAPSAVAALGRVREAYEREAYGGGGRPVAVADVDTVLETIERGAPVADRLRATLAPRSLLGAVGIRRPSAAPVSPHAPTLVTRLKSRSRE